MWYGVRLSRRCSTGCARPTGEALAPLARAQRVTPSSNPPFDEVLRIRRTEFPGMAQRAAYGWRETARLYTRSSMLCTVVVNPRTGCRVPGVELVGALH